jgi:hypothetical protein
MEAGNAIHLIDLTADHYLASDKSNGKIARRPRHKPQTMEHSAESD